MTLLPTRRRPATNPLSRPLARRYSCPMKHHALPMSATPRRDATPLSASVTDAECDPQEVNFHEVIQLPYPEPLRPATRLFPETNLTQLRLFRNNSLGPATTGGNCLKTIHPCPATTGSNCLRTIHPCQCPRHAGALAAAMVIPVSAGLPSQSCGRCARTAFRLVVHPHVATPCQYARERCPAMDTVVPFYRYPALAFYGTIVLEANQWLFRSFAHD